MILTWADETLSHSLTSAGFSGTHVAFLALARYFWHPAVVFACVMLYLFDNGPRRDTERQKWRWFGEGRLFYIFSSSSCSSSLFSSLPPPPSRRPCSWCVSKDAIFVLLCFFFFFYCVCRWFTLLKLNQRRTEENRCELVIHKKTINSAKDYLSLRYILVPHQRHKKKYPQCCPRFLLVYL